MEFSVCAWHTQRRRVWESEWRPQTVPEEQERYWLCVSVCIMIQLWAAVWVLFLKMSDSWNTGHCHFPSEKLCWDPINVLLMLREHHSEAFLPLFRPHAVFVHCCVLLSQCYFVLSTLVQLCHIALMIFAQMIHRDVCLWNGSVSWPRILMEPEGTGRASNKIRLRGSHISLCCKVQSRSNRQLFSVQSSVLFWVVWLCSIKQLYCLSWRDLRLL